MTLVDVVSKEPILDKESIQLLKNDVDFHEFIADVEDAMDAIEKHVRSDDFKAAAHSAHYILSRSLTLGTPRLAAVAAEVDKAAQGKDRIMIQNGLKLMGRVVKETAAALEAI